ncbi:MAG: hypothetical protein RL684_267 [Pseudomonadota bacterium]|jgi:hypothetical protein
MAVLKKILLRVLLYPIGIVVAAWAVILLFTEFPRLPTLIGFAYFGFGFLFLIVLLFVWLTRAGRAVWRAGAPK